MNYSNITKQDLNIRKRIELTGYIQGVGFRPFVYRIAKLLDLTGFVYNQNGKVVIEIQGRENSIDKFVNEIFNNKPPNAIIENMYVFDRISTIEEENDFIIKKSQYVKNNFSYILPDIAICDDCKKEILDPNNKRYFYPFINCTNCGPRFTIIKDHPYDRINTTMHIFFLCNSCKKEYEDPENRRFHAEPIACPICGPIYISITKEEINTVNGEYLMQYIQNKFHNVHKNIISIKESIRYNQELISQAINYIKNNKIIAIKGIGGYHIACDLFNDEVVMELRKRKKRELKPFAIMFPDLESIKEFCSVSQEEIDLLLSKEAPIVLVKAKKRFSKYVIPEPQNYIGAFLPYSPIHYLLMKLYNQPLIMTSANLSDQPIFYKENKELKKIWDIADLVLINNREIYFPCDDSVIKKFYNKNIVFRKGRGYSPNLLIFPEKHYKILALGSQLKNTFSMLHNNNIITSQYIGDLDDLDTFNLFLHNIEKFKRLYYFNPDFIAIDYHPNYENTKWALENFKKEQIIFVQHHHAHIVSCMFENNIKEDVLGIAMDGTGFGITKNHPRIVGGEVYIANYKKFLHVGSLLPFSLIGGEKSIKDIKRITLSLLYEYYKYFLKQDDFYKWVIHNDYLQEIFENKKELKILIDLLERNIQTYEVSSCGRLLDGISYLLNICKYSNYEGLAAISLEQKALEYNINTCSTENYYEYKLIKKNTILYVDWRYMIKSILEDLKKHQIPFIALKVHITIAKAYSDIIFYLQKKFKMNKVVLSGGCFQNIILLEYFKRFLENKIEVFIHNKLSPGDNSISIGQAIIANEILMNNRK